MVIGGCAYRMQLRAELATSLAAIAHYSAVGNPSLPIPIAYDFRHTSNLPAARCYWIRDQVARVELDYAVSVDSDCWPVDPVQFLAELGRALPRGGADIAMWTAPVFQDNGLINWRTWSEFYEPEELRRAPTVNEMALLDDLGYRPKLRKQLVQPRVAELREILAGARELESTGFGLVVLNLAWWRAHWPEPTPAINHIGTGEDIELGRGVRDRGGRILPLNVEMKHAAFTV